MESLTPSSTDLLFDVQTLKEELEQLSGNNKSPLLPLKQAVKSIYETQIKQFQDQQSVVHLIHARSQAIDIILSLAWSFYHLDEHAALLAVGGYGRGELHPYSDVDLLLLLDAEHDQDLQAAQEPDNESQFSRDLHSFIALLWDIGLEIGHSVRTVAECIVEAKNDITIISNLMESRLITGDSSLYEQLSCQLSP